MWTDNIMIAQSFWLCYGGDKIMADADIAHENSEKRQRK